MIRKNTSHSISPGKFFSVCLLACCLIFLTSVNYFLYPSSKESSSIHHSSPKASEKSQNYPPSGPTEEKSSTQGFSIVEEFLHESHPALNFAAADPLFLKHLTEASRILYFHGELISPPPEL